MEIIEDKKRLTSDADIQQYFNDRTYFDCGQGYYQDVAEVYAKIDNVYYLVTMVAEVYGEKQDIGEEMYFVDSVAVSYQQVEFSEVQNEVNKDIVSMIESHKEQIEKLQTQMI